VIDKSNLTKRYYSISEVADLFGIASSVLRYWENEFKTLNPSKGRNGIRRYTIDDIDEIEKIHDLLKNRGFTIDGAKKELKSYSTSEDALTRKLLKLKSRLEYLRDHLEEE
jgi:DNA-binding transcriptional MerR regulator